MNDDSELRGSGGKSRARVFVLAVAGLGLFGVAAFLIFNQMVRPRLVRSAVVEAFQKAGLKGSFEAADFQGKELRLKNVHASVMASPFMHFTADDVVMLFAPGPGRNVSSVTIHRALLAADSEAVPPAFREIREIDARAVLNGGMLSLEKFEGKWNHASVQLSGQVTNIAGWKNSSDKSSELSEKIETWLQRCEWNVSSNSLLKLHFAVDAAHVESSVQFQLDLNEIGVRSAGSATALSRLRLTSHRENGLLRLNVDARADWKNESARAEKLEIAGDLPLGTNLAPASISVKAAGLSVSEGATLSPSFQWKTTRWSWSHPPANWQSHWTSQTFRWHETVLSNLGIEVSAIPKAGAAIPDWSGWLESPMQATNDWVISLRANLDHLDDPRLEAGPASMDVTLDYSTLTVNQARIGWRGESNQLNGSVDLLTREMRGEWSGAPGWMTWSNTVAQKIPGIASHISAATAPAIQVSFKSQWPLTTTNLWRDLALQANATAVFNWTNISISQLSIDAVEGTVSYTNGHWGLANFQALMDRYFLQASGELSTNQTFHLNLETNLKPEPLRPLLTPDQWNAAKKIVSLNGDVWMKASIGGQGTNWNSLVGSGQFKTGALVAREQSFDALSADVLYQTGLWTLTNVLIMREGLTLTGDEIKIDPSSGRVDVTNTVTTISPQILATALGRDAEEAVEPYHYNPPPLTKVNGYFYATNPEKAGIHFLVSGDGFEWGHFHAAHASAQVDWVDTFLVVTNISATAYGGGDVMGWVNVDFTPAKGCDYWFDIGFDKIQLRDFLVDFKPTKKPFTGEGLLEGNLRIDHANTKDVGTLLGHGHFILHDGLIWEIPIFGFLSPAVNAVLPGLGKSRVRQAWSTFQIKDRKVITDDLEIRAPAFRMAYKGTVDFDQNMEARVDAEILRDAPVVGKMVSVATSPFAKLFEYRIWGSLDDPKGEPVYIPKIVVKTLHPFRTIKEMLPNRTPKEP